jgi:hypothetical protein
LKGTVFRRRALNPRRFKGLGAFAATYGLYSYMPYIAAYVGTTLPIVTACFTGLYGLLAFAEQHLINEIRVIAEGKN